MPVTTTEISKYSVSVVSDAEPNNFEATIWLFDHAGKVIAFLRYFAPGSVMKENEFRSDLGHPLISFPSTALAPTVDILRNEKPTYFTWYDYSPVRCFGTVGTSREPAGEEEGV